MDQDEVSMKKESFFSEFVRESQAVCSNGKTLCSLMVDLGYSGKGSASFTWRMCAEEILDNLLMANGYILRCPIPSPDGEFVYGGDRFTVKEIDYREDMNDDYFE